ncbi:hypothetical protein ACFQE1_08030 [Halobium palmae]|uniref:Uncharacterized protein n=1 Tax=Halobium palmae TaxID=1776492 RepID=A0ABD5RXZ9_9EURY
MPNHDTADSPGAISRSLYEQGMTDGLPVHPPTEDAVAEMLRGTARDRDHVLGRLGNNENALTVEKLASNAVMAGCLPPYMPVLEAGARALADPKSNSIQVSVSTGSWAYQWIINGPVREELDIESGTGAFGPNFHANRTIGRALGLAYKNTANLRPGEKDMGVMGNPFKFSLLAGENQEHSPWEPYHVTHGYDAEESTITLAGPNSFVQYFPHENTADEILKGMVRNTPPSMVGGEQQGGDIDQTIFHLVNRYNAEELAGIDATKRDVKEYICENSYLRTEDYQKGSLWDGVLRRHEGKGSPLQVAQVDDPEYVKVVTVGGPGRVNAIVGPSIGGPVTKRIEFPNDWDALVEEYALDRRWFDGVTY